MRLPFTRRPVLGCPTCDGKGEVVVNNFAMTKGKILKSISCPSCIGRGTLRHR